LVQPIGTSAQGANIANVESGGIRIGQRIEGYNLQTGALLWNKTVDEPPIHGASNVAEPWQSSNTLGQRVLHSIRPLDRTASLETEALDYPWDEPAGHYYVISAYGTTILGSSNSVDAIDWETANKLEIRIATPFHTKRKYTSANWHHSLSLPAPGNICATENLRLRL